MATQPGGAAAGLALRLDFLILHEGLLFHWKRQIKEFS